MKIAEISRVFGALREEFDRLGLIETKIDDYSIEFEKSDKLKLEFVSERYDEDVNILVSGPFSRDNRLVLGILAHAVDPVLATDIRLGDPRKNAHQIVRAALVFLEKYAESLVQTPDKYLSLYEDKIRQLRNEHGLKDQ